MKNRNLFFIIFMLLLAACLYSCNDNGNDTKTIPYECEIVDVSSVNPDFELLILNEEKHQIGIGLTEESAEFSSLCFYNTESGKSATIVWDEENNSLQIYEDGCTFVMSNLKSNTCDLGIFTSDGEVYVSRNIELSNTDWNEFFGIMSGIKSEIARIDVSAFHRTKSTYTSKPFIQFLKEEYLTLWNDYLVPELTKVATITLGAYGCVMAATSKLPLPSLIKGSAAITVCGSHFRYTIETALGREISSSEKLKWDVSKMTATAVTDCVGGNKYICLFKTLTGLVSSLKNGIDALSKERENINSIQGVLKGGYGALQINLVWNKPCDIDLHVVDPDFNPIFWNSPTSPSGGFLDFDDRTGTGPENVFWKENAPEGRYDVSVNFYEGYYDVGPVDWIVTIVRPLGNGLFQANSHKGKLTYHDQSTHVATFSIGNDKRSLNDREGYIYKRLQKK